MEKTFTTDLHNRYLIYGKQLLIKKNAADKVRELQIPYEERKPKGVI